MASLGFRSDGLTGGSSRHFSAPDRSISYFALPDGKVWNIQLRSGMGERCGRPEPLIAGYRALIRTVAPTAEITSGQRTEFERGFSTPTGAKIEIGKIRITSMGDCIRAFDIRTVSTDAE